MIVQRQCFLIIVWIEENGANGIINKPNGFRTL